MWWTLSFTVLAVFFQSWSLQAAPFNPKSVLSASKGKHNQYISEGVIRGGDPLSHPTTLDKVRWGKKWGYERLVIDLKSSGVEWKQKVPPYFQVGVDPVHGKFDLSIRYIDFRNVDQEKLNRVIAKSNLIKSAYLAPKLEGSLASMEFKVTTPIKLEGFYLLNPPRIILDIQAK